MSANTVYKFAFVAPDAGNQQLTAAHNSGIGLKLSGGMQHAKCMACTCLAATTNHACIVYVRCVLCCLYWASGLLAHSPVLWRHHGADGNALHT